MPNIEEFVPGIKESRGINSAFPINAPLTATSATDGQLMAWSTTLNQWTPVTSTGGVRLAAASNTTATATTATTTGGVGTAVAITGTSVSISTSNGLPAVFEWGATLQQTAATDGVALLSIYETTSSPTALVSAYTRLPNSVTSPMCFWTSSWTYDAGIISSTRTFQVYLQVWNVSGTATIKSLNGTSTTNPTFLRVTTGM